MVPSPPPGHLVIHHLLRSLDLEGRPTFEASFVPRREEAGRRGRRTEERDEEGGKGGSREGREGSGGRGARRSEEMNQSPKGGGSPCEMRCSKEFAKGKPLMYKFKPCALNIMAMRRELPQ